MKIKTSVITFLAFILTSCMPSITLVPTETPVPIVTFTPVPSSTFTPVPATITPASATMTPMPIPLPTQLTAQAASYPTHVVMTPNPDQLERWQEYEDALRNRLRGYEVLNNTFLCEWEILGQSAREVYVSAFCMSTLPLEGLDTDRFLASSRPAVIELNEDGSIQNVEVPRAGTYARDIREMFPSDVQENIRNFYPDRGFKEHILYRAEHPAVPPLIVLNATPMP